MTSQVLGLTEIEGKTRIEFNMKRVVILTLLFTNAYFLTVLFTRLVSRG